FLSEITLAVILTLLGLAILIILLARWTRRKQNDIEVSRYSSEQSGLLEYEDGRAFPSQKSKRGRGFRHAYSTESDTSYDDRGDSKCLKATREPFLQFTAPIPGATGPIKLSQKTIVQTPGPIVQYTGPSADTSDTTTLSPLVIFPGYMDGELAKKSDPKARILKSGSITKAQSSQEESKKTLIKEVTIADSEGSLISRSKKESIGKAKSTELGKDKIETEVKVEESDAGILKGKEAQVKKSDTGILKGPDSQVKKSDTSIPKGQESQGQESDAGILKGQESQAKKSDSGIPKGQESQAKKSDTGIPDTGIPKKSGSQAKKSDTGISKGQESQAKKSEAGVPKGQAGKAKQGDAGIPKEPEAQAKDKGKKGDDGKDNVKGKKEAEVKGKKVEAPAKGKGK
ncbi:testis-expressed basic protein 1, partial [Trichechus manatus latirostris]|uniref:Testis-expressed basic protein 1 n=1 Tax=Trichechus manatus latirostris TaxID=127582 RepID=A0A2Y9ECV6_TRIMA